MFARSVCALLGFRAREFPAKFEKNWTFIVDRRSYVWDHILSSVTPPMVKYSFFKSWLSGILDMLYLAAGSHQHLYQYMQNYVVIGLIKIPWIDQGDKLILNSICIIF